MMRYRKRKFVVGIDVKVKVIHCQKKRNICEIQRWEKSKLEEGRRQTFEKCFLDSRNKEKNFKKRLKKFNINFKIKQ